MTRRRSPWLAAALLLTAAASFAAVRAPFLPRLSGTFPSDAFSARPVWLAVATLGIGLALLALSLHRRARAGAPAALALVLAGAWVAALGLLAASPEGWFAIPDRVYAGMDADLYQDTARFDGPASVVPEYEGEKPQLFPRAKTHPPGPVLFYACTNEVAGWLAGIGDPEERELRAFRLEGIVAGLSLVLLAALWIPGLFLLLRPRAGEHAALAGAVLAAGVPVTSLAGPGVDALSPALALAPLLLLDRGRAQHGPRPLAAGAVLGLVLLAGFHMLALLAAYGLFLAWREPLARAAGRFALLVLGAAAALAGVLALTGYSYAADFLESLAYHRENVTASRDYLVSLWAAPATFLLWIGVPVAAGFLAAGLRALRPPPRSGPPAADLAGPGLAVLLVLTAAGLSRAETDRLWLPLAPFAVGAAAAFWTRELRPGGARWTVLVLALWAQTLVFKGWLFGSFEKA